MYLPRTSRSPEQPVDCSSPNFPAELMVAAVSNWWQQFKSSAASTVSPKIADTAAVVMPCVGRGCCRYRLALLPCCQWRHQCWQWLQSWRSSIVWELVKEFRAVKVQTCETLNKKCQISLTCCDKRKASQVLWTFCYLKCFGEPDDCTSHTISEPPVLLVTTV